MKREVKWAIVVTVVVEVMFFAIMTVVLGAIGFDPSLGGITHFFGGNVFVELTVIVGLLPLYGVGLALLAVVASGAFYKILKLLMRINREKYGFARVMMKPRGSFRRYYFQALIPSFMAISIALTLSAYRGFFTPLFTDLILQLAQPSTVGPFVGVASFFFLPFCTLPFLLLWALNDSGIIITAETSGDWHNFYMENFGDHFLKYLEGFTGLSVIIGYTAFSINTLLAFYPDWFAVIPISVSMIAIPFMLAMFVFPAKILCERWMLSGRHTLKSTLEGLTNISDKLVELEKGFHGG